MSAEQHHERLRDRLPERWYRDVALIVITGIMALALISFDGQVKKTDRLTADIQDQRAESILTACREQNVRHDNTVAELDRAIAGLKPGPRKRRAMARRNFTVRLVDALAPRTDCKQRVRELVPTR